MSAPGRDLAHNTWLELREPGCVPMLKGPFRRDQLKPFLVELTTFRKSALITVITIGDDGKPSVQDGPECLEVLDARFAPRAARHRMNTDAAWRERDQGPSARRGT